MGSVLLCHSDSAKCLDEVVEVPVGLHSVDNNFDGSYWLAW